MSAVPTSLMAAITMSAATGKNPWLPFGLLFAIAAPATMPAFLVDPALHRALHGLAAPEVLYGLAVVFLVLGTVESLADKVPLIERWLVPASTAWRPFASVALSSLIAYAVATTFPAGASSPAYAAAGMAVGWPLGVTMLAVVTVVAGSLAGLFAALGKTAQRLLLGWVPVPGLRLLHSFGDDLFAVGAVGAGLAFADSIVMVVVVTIYFVVGFALAPVAARLAAIHVRGTIARLRETRRLLAGDAPAVEPPIPRWLERWLGQRGITPAGAGVLEGWVLRAPGIGWCRRGAVVLSEHGVAFVQARWFGPPVCEHPWATVGRVGLAESVTGRTLVIEWDDGGRGRIARVTLFATPGEHLDEAIRRGTASPEVTEVKPDSTSARGRLVGFAASGDGRRYRTPDELGDLRLQALVTLAAAAAMGVLTAGVIIPVGFGYLLSPFRRRFWAGLMITAYLSLSVVGSAFFGWPAAVAYAIILNAVCLRDLARQHFRARIDGFVDLDAFMPPVCGRVWIPSHAIDDPADRCERIGQTRRAGDDDLADVSWRRLVAAGGGRPQ